MLEVTEEGNLAEVVEVNAQCGVVEDDRVCCLHTARFVIISVGSDLPTQLRVAGISVKVR